MKGEEILPEGPHRPGYAECLGCGDRTSEDESELDDNGLCSICVKNKEEECGNEGRRD